MKAVAACLLLVLPAFACDCLRRSSACYEVNGEGAVFIGTVEAATPAFMSRWSPVPRPNLRQINEADQRYLADRSAANLNSLKDAFRQLFPSLPEEQAHQLNNASNHAMLVSLFSSVLAHGQRVHLRVRTVFRDGNDDNDAGKDKKKDAAKPADDDEEKLPEALDVWTPFGDCGVDFQPGETYLVYANSDEETNILSTEICSRTRRLSDAGDDLAYLFYFKDKKQPAARLEGFATFDPLYQVHQSPKNDPDRIDQPAAGVVVELKTRGGPRYATTNQYGRFVFDGLDGGDYQVSAYRAGFPETIRLLAGPKTVRAESRGCASQTLLIPKDSP